MRWPGISGNVPVLLDLEASSEEEAIVHLTAALSGDPGVKDIRELERTVLQRQRVQPPLLGREVALPHARTAAVSRIVMAVGRCRQPVAFGSEKIPVRLLFLFGVPASCIGEYLAVVASLTRVLKVPGKLDALISAEDEVALEKILTNP